LLLFTFTSAFPSRNLTHIGLLVKLTMGTPCRLQSLWFDRSLSHAYNPKKRNIMSIEIGSKAPSFTLKSANGPGDKDDFGLSNVTLSDNIGQKNTVILFVPLAFTGVCTQELCDITSGLAEYSDLNADVIAISVDSPFAQGQWAKNENIGITLASDLNKQTAKDYGVLLDDLIGVGSVSARAAFVVDKEGTVQYAEQTETPKDLPNFDAIKETLAKLG